MTLNCSATARSTWFSLTEQSDGVEVCEGPGILHNSVLCRLHGPREQDWWRNVNPEHRIDARHLIADPVFSDRFTGREHRIGDALRIQRIPCWRQPKLLIWCWSWNFSTWPGKSYDFKFVAFTDTYRELIWMHLLIPKSDPDFTEDLRNRVIDVPPARAWSTQQKTVAFHWTEWRSWSLRRTRDFARLWV